MSRFYGTIDGSAGRATRMGTAKSGLTTHAAGWSGAIRVTVYADGDNDRFRVERVPWQNSGGATTTLAEGDLVATDGRITDRAALDAIHRVMDQPEWSPDILDQIADVLLAAGRSIGDPEWERES